jgi:DNA-binding response OmpR family regulator
MGDKEVSEKIEILLIEDNPGDTELIRQMLEGVSASGFHVVVEKDLSSGLNSLGDGHFDLILLDLGLPDSQGLETLLQVYSQSSAVPIVVLTGRADEDLGTEAVRNGAQDYLVKGDLDRRLLIRSIQYSLDRHRLQEQLQEKRDQERRENDHRSLEEIARSSRPSAIARAYGKIPLKESSSSKFAEIVQRYDRLLEMALEQKEFKVEHNVSGDLKKIAEEIGDLGCTPLDVIEIHATAMESKGREVRGKRLRAFEEEGRLQVLQLMGFLTSFYRRYYVRYPANKPAPEGEK